MRIGDLDVEGPKQSVDPQHFASLGGGGRTAHTSVPIIKLIIRHSRSAEVHRLALYLLEPTNQLVKLLFRVDAILVLRVGPELLAAPHQLFIGLAVDDSEVVDKVRSFFCLLFALALLVLCQLPFELALL